MFRKLLREFLGKDCKNKKYDQYDVFQICALMDFADYLDTPGLTTRAADNQAIEMLIRVRNADRDGTDLPSDLVNDIDAFLKTPGRS